MWWIYAINIKLITQILMHNPVILSINYWSFFHNSSSYKRLVDNGKLLSILLSAVPICSAWKVCYNVDIHEHNFSFPFLSSLLRHLLLFLEVNLIKTFSCTIIYTACFTFLTYLPTIYRMSVSGLFKVAIFQSELIHYKMTSWKRYLWTLYRTNVMLICSR